MRVLSRRRDHPTHHETELALFFTRHHSSVPCLGHSSSRARAHSAAQFRGDRRPWSRDFRPCAKRALCGSSNVNQEFPEGKVGKTHLVLVSEAVQGVEYAHLVSTALPFAVIADDFCVTGVNGSFTLGTPNGDLYRLKGHHNALFHYNGMEVRVTGTVTPSKPSSASKRVSGTMPQTLKIAKIEKLRDTC